MMPACLSSSRAVRALLGLTVVLALALSAGGCRSGDAEAPPRLTVFTAASLTDAFEEIAQAFEERPDARAVLNVAGSQQLAQQLAQGAPGDVFASANEQQMQVAVESERVAAGAPRIFARNELIVVTPLGNPGDVAALADLARPGLRLVLAAEAVPAGRYARRVLAQASASDDFETNFEQQVLGNAVSFEQNVRAVLTKVALGEADAGIVYATDAAGPRSDDVRRIAIPHALNVTAAYPIAPVENSEHPALAAAFVDFVLSQRGQSILSSYGFLPIRSEDAPA